MRDFLFFFSSHVDSGDLIRWMNFRLDSNNFLSSEIFLGWKDKNENGIFQLMNRQRVTSMIRQFRHLFPDGWQNDEYSIRITISFRSIFRSPFKSHFHIMARESDQVRWHPSTVYLIRWFS